MPANNLLSALSASDRAALEPLMRAVDLPPGKLLHEARDMIEYCWFPCGAAIASFLVVMDDGLAVETAMVGREGALGGIVSHGRLPAFARAVVVQGGTFLKVPLRALEAAKRDCPAIDRLFTRYADCFVAQIFQSVACNATHTIEQRAARWLLAAIERTDDTRITMSQEQLGTLLGVGRSYTSRVLQRFKAAGLIAIHRGGLVVNHPESLKAIACTCNDAVHGHFDRVLRGVYPELLPA